ncbi:CoA transferase [Acidithrix sp. C25]|uniref:CaiB/BaiF CoA transferase family protein n=1 Tax=Acidithrix sp. C25 TaxID=1671482 RepID=UPI00191B9391|nr:CoA transferase [Acidithrix sp. C25]CAG4913082.1 unnamed protein product [Acidithrix sp. C25]
MNQNDAEFAKKVFDPDYIGALDGVRVLDLSRLVSGNIASMLLGDFGADVIKVEPPEGDPLRAWRDGGESLYWKTYSRNKRSIVLNLRVDAAKAVLLSLVEESEVLIENFKPGTLEEMGLSPEVLLKRNPKLVILRISGFGQDGPYSPLPGFGSLVEAMSGLADRTGFSDREPVLPPFPVADMTAGLYGAMATLLALRSLDHALSAGQVIDLSLLEPLFSLLGPDAAIYNLTGEVKQRVGSASNTTAPRNVYRCLDGKYIALSGSMPSMAERIFQEIGRPDLIDDPRFVDNSARILNRDELDELLGGWFATKSSKEALEKMRAAKATVGPVYDIADVFRDRHFIEREILVSIPDDDLGEIPVANIVPRLSATPGRFSRPAPSLGLHTLDILLEAGLTRAAIDDLIRAGAVKIA